MIFLLSRSNFQKKNDGKDQALQVTMANVENRPARRYFFSCTLWARVVDQATPDISDYFLKTSVMAVLFLVSVIASVVAMPQ